MATQMLRARCAVRPLTAANPSCTGVVTFAQPARGGPCLVFYDITGLAPGPHGFRVHQKGASSSSAVVCDLGNIVADEGGNTRGTTPSAVLQLGGDSSVVGGFATVTGADGARVGVGEIVRVVGSDSEIKPPPAGTTRMLKLVRPLPVIGGSVAAWVIMFCYHMGRQQLPPQLLPCPPISLFTCVRVFLS
jgi:hypothetical protein